jgi:serine/threonine protein kinase
VFGYHPINPDNRNRDVVEERLKNYTEIKFPDEPQVSPQVQHLISSLCQQSVSGRFTAADALEHPWITRKLD